jgi:tetratricopeptide (TPR) repeat protein
VNERIINHSLIHNSLISILYQIIFYITFLINNLSSISSVSDRNEWKEKAAIAYQKKDYKTTIEFYEKLIDASVFIEPSLRLNLANSYFILNDTIHAKAEYRKLLKLNDEAMVSRALNQLGALSAMSKDSTFALQLFKEALISSPENRFARFNYELIKKKLPPNPPRPPQNQEQEQNQELATGSPEKSEEKEDELQSMRPEDMSREKALQLLESMKSSESQYVKKRKGSGGESKKDW